MNKHKVLTVVVGIAIMIGGMVIIKANAFGPPHHGGGGLGFKTLMELDLSDSQKAAVRNIVGKYREQGEPIRDQLLEAKENTRDVVEAEPFDEENVRQAFKEILPLLEEAMVLKTKCMVELRSILNPDQLELLKEKRAEVAEKMKKGMRFRESMIDTWLQMDTE